jgi:hypothetical protein
MHGKYCTDADQNLAFVSYVRGSFEKFVDWRQCAAVMQRETVTVMPSCSGRGIVVMA